MQEGGFTTVWIHHVPVCMELKVDEVLSSILPSLPALAFKLDNTEPLLGNILSLDCTALEHTCNY